MSKISNCCPLKNFYKYGLMEMIHELGNMVQKMICISYEMESNGEEVTKLNSRINIMTQMIKIYTGIYTNSTYTFQEMIEMIQIFHNCPITLTGDFLDFNESERNFIGLHRVLLIYAMWISKRHEITIKILDNNTAELDISNPNGSDLERMYSLDPDSDSIYVKILGNLGKFGLQSEFKDGVLRVQVG